MKKNKTMILRRSQRMVNKWIPFMAKFLLLSMIASKGNAVSLTDQIEKMEMEVVGNSQAQGNGLNRKKINLADLYFKVGAYDKGAQVLTSLLKTTDNTGLQTQIAKTVGRFQPQILEFNEFKKQLAKVTSSTETGEKIGPRLLAITDQYPEFFESKFLLAKYYVSINEYREAENWLDKINSEAVLPQQRAMVKELSKEINENLEWKKNWRSGVGFALGHDSNVSGFQDNEYIEETQIVNQVEKGGAYGNLTAYTNLGVKQPIGFSKDNDQLVSGNVGLSYYQRDYEDSFATQRNFAVKDFNTKVRITYPNSFAFEFPFSYQELDLSDKPYARYWNARFRIGWQPEGHNLLIEQGFKLKDYSLGKLDIQNSLYNSFAFQDRFKMIQNLSLIARVELGNQVTKGIQYRSYDQKKVELSIEWRPIRRLRTKLTSEFRDTNYKGKNNNFIRRDGTLRYDFNREDDRFRYRLQFDYRVSKAWNVRWDSIWLNSQSNQQVYDYSRTTHTIGVRARF